STFSASGACSDLVRANMRSSTNSSPEPPWTRLWHVRARPPPDTDSGGGSRTEKSAMLLPFECLAYRIYEGRVLPSWLGEPDEPFVATVLDGVAGLAGLQVGDEQVVA